MSKRISGKPRRPRNPVAKAVRTPAFKLQVVPDKRGKKCMQQADEDSRAAMRKKTEKDEEKDQ